jgi:predicted Rossmann-fold nucleotide-binding protein
MRIIVCGGRRYSDRAAVFRILDRLHAKKGIDFLIQGSADGADYLAWQWADERDVPCGSYAADWDEIDHPDAIIRYRKGKPYNAAAGAIRNQRMIDKGKPDGVVAFPGGPGTADMIRRAQAAGIRVWS